MFEVSVTDEQILKLLDLFPAFDGIVDTVNREEFNSEIAKHFVGMKVPTYGDAEEYSEKFYKAIEAKKEDFLAFISK